MYKTKSFETVDFADGDLKEALATWISEKMLAAVEGLQTEFQALLDKNGARNLHGMDTTTPLDSQHADVDAAISIIEPVPLLYATDRRSTLYVEEGADACQVCDVDLIIGPGSGLCKTTPDACAALSLNHAEAAEPAPAFDYDDINFEPYCPGHPRQDLPNCGLGCGIMWGCRVRTSRCPHLRRTTSRRGGCLRTLMQTAQRQNACCT